MRLPCVTNSTSFQLLPTAKSLTIRLFVPFPKKCKHFSGALNKKGGMSSALDYFCLVQVVGLEPTRSCPLRSQTALHFNFCLSPKVLSFVCLFLFPKNAKHFSGTLNKKGGMSSALDYSSLVPMMGVEPIRPCELGILSPVRLPFRHIGSIFI